MKDEAQDIPLITFSWVTERTADDSSNVGESYFVSKSMFESLNVNSIEKPFSHFPFRRMFSFLLLSSAAVEGERLEAI